MTDSYGRTIDYLRISVTDRCNARCVYCMPAAGIQKLEHCSILTYEEITFIARICAQKGIRYIRLTGGDPLVRRDISELVAMLKAVRGIEKVYLTTNGIDLENQLGSLLRAGIDGINVSLDAVSEQVFAGITRLPENQHNAAKIIRAIDMACSVPGFTVKINCVASGLNDNELVPVAELARARNICVRFIELMPIGCGQTCGLQFRSGTAVRKLLEGSLGKLEPADGRRYEYFRPRSFKGTIGFISPVTHRFCSSCNRLRLTADGYIKTCLEYAGRESLKPILSAGLTEETAVNISTVLDREISLKPERNHFYENSDNTGCNGWNGRSHSVAEQRTMNEIGG